MSQAPHDLPAAFDRHGRPGRRRFVSGACAAALLAFAAAGGSRAPFGMGRALAATPAATPASGSGYDAFIKLSQRLTGRTSFNAVLGKRVYAALDHASSQFDANVATLNTWIQGHGGVPSDTVTAALKTDQPELASMVGDIMRAWYLGLVGEMPKVQVVAFEKALMFDPVNDVLTIPSYCRDVPFYWKLKPGGE
ncbi:sugar dehydrogenase complex small subunit [Paraburkholderia sp. JHI869]|uniref:sugar dehydrogenase complex small subunit n=1 Tax=Paraburkholderia sp. JHI869 TaxID=3112959 RepID=UPI003178F349